MDAVPKRTRTVNREVLPPNGDDRGGVDRLSCLPSEIICHILSLLSTKDAIRTSVLSVRWKNLFTLIPNLKILLVDHSHKHPNLVTDTSLINFKNFVDRLLYVILPRVHSIYGFCLVCLRFNDGREIAKWVDATLRLNIQRVDLRVVRIRNSSFIFDSLFGANITILNLLLHFSDRSPEYRFSLPNLKMMSVQYMRANCVNPLLEGCPVLRILVLHNCYCVPGEVIRVCNPLLRALKIQNGLNHFHGDLKLDLPNLLYLRYEGFLPNRYLARRLESLRTARLDLDELNGVNPYGYSVEVAVLISICSRAEKLWLSEKIITMFHRFPPPLVMFQHLVNVGIAKMNSKFWELLPIFLRCSPNLKNLFVESGFDNESYESFKASLDKSASVTVSPCDNGSHRLVFERKAENELASA